MKKLDQVLNEFLLQTAALFFKALHRLSLYLPKEVGSSKSLKCVEVNELKKENRISARASHFLVHFLAVTSHTT